MSALDFEHSNRLAIALEQEHQRTQRLLQQPHVYLKAKVYKDGDKWCCLYGEDLVMGVCAFGDSPMQSAMNFDSVWQKGTIV